MTTKIRLLRCYVLSTLFKGFETWTLTASLSKRLEAFEMWLYRRILRVPWTAHATNGEILRKLKEEKEVLATVKTRKIQYLGHIMRNKNRYQFLQTILQGKIPGKRSAGRRKMSWLKNIEAWTCKVSCKWQEQHSQDGCQHPERIGTRRKKEEERLLERNLPFNALS